MKEKEASAKAEPTATDTSVLSSTVAHASSTDGAASKRMMMILPELDGAGGDLLHEDGTAAAAAAIANHLAVEEYQLSRENLELLMREQDADLLESIHSSGANASGMTPVLSSVKLGAAPPLPVPPLSLDGKDEENDDKNDDDEDGVQEEMVREVTCSSPPDVSPLQRNRRGSNRALQHLSSSSLLALSVSDQIKPSLQRRALSGEIFTGLSEQDYGEYQEAEISVSQITELEKGDKERDGKLERSESMDRRINEAAQFAEAVGDLQPAEQEELRIIEEEPDDDTDDDDDDDATVIRVEETSAEPSGRQELSSTFPTELKVPKTRPQWPFGNQFSKRIFLYKLPDQGSSTQDFVYKGIQSNPPEIVKSGTTRGNYAQLHRKAWLEVSDKYHRYGKNLRLYYRYWESLGCPTNMFFDWLDSKGEAAGQPLPELEECPRATLDSDTVLYIMNPDVSAAYAIKFIPDQNGRGRAVDVDGETVTTGPEGWIFVLRDGVFYAAAKITSVTGHSKQRFHHSSFFGGKAVAAAGIFITDDEGILTKLYPHSGHYRPGEAHMQRVLFHMHNEGVSLRTFEMDMQQILHVARDKEPKDVQGSAEDKAEKKKKIDALHLVPAVHAACFLAHKARFIGNNIFSQIHQIRKAEVTSVSEALAAIDP